MLRCARERTLYICFVGGDFLPWATVGQLFSWSEFISFSVAHVRQSICIHTEIQFLVDQLKPTGYNADGTKLSSCFCVSRQNGSTGILARM